MRTNDLNQLRYRLADIKNMGWIENQRPGNDGGVGNTLEDLLDVAENNLQLPDFGAWELKAQRDSTSSLLTLFHTEPKPRSARIVPQVLIPKYGWPSQGAGTRYPAHERSFRATLNTSFSDRGLKVVVDYTKEQIRISFDYRMVDNRHQNWLADVIQKAGTDNIDPAPYWDFSDIEAKLKTKLKNMMYVRADHKKENGKEYFKYNHFEAYVDPSLEQFLHLIERGDIYIDFDARTGHNHGTKFRIRPSAKREIYESYIEV